MTVDRSTLPDWPARMGAELAAAYVGVSMSKFLADVKAETKPKPVKDGGRVLWHRAQLDNFLARERGEIPATGGDQLLAMLEGRT